MLGLNNGFILGNIPDNNNLLNLFRFNFAVLPVPGDHLPGRDRVRRAHLLPGGALPQRHPRQRRGHRHQEVPQQFHGNHTDFRSHSGGGE